MKDSHRISHSRSSSKFKASGLTLNGPTGIDKLSIIPNLSKRMQEIRINQRESLIIVKQLVLIPRQTNLLFSFE